MAISTKVLDANVFTGANCVHFTQDDTARQGLVSFFPQGNVYHRASFGKRSREFLKWYSS